MLVNSIRAYDAHSHHIDAENIVKRVAPVRPAPRVVEKVITSDSGWLPPITYTRDGVVHYGTPLMRVGQVVDIKV